jgi:hypothetical protein
VKNLEVFGDRKRFAIGVELDPTPSFGEPSWGYLQIWVGGQNLTSGLTSEGEELSVAEVPLLPVVRWLIEHWDGLLHEERLPVETDASNAAAWRVDSMLELPPGDKQLEELLECRERYWAEHGMGSSLPGFRIPDLHIRRIGNELELSWDDREWRTVSPGIQLSERRGVAIVPAQETVAALEGFIERALELLAAPCPDQVAALGKAFDALAAPERLLVRLRMATGDVIDRLVRRLTALVTDGTKPAHEIFESLVGVKQPLTAWSHRFAEFPTPVLLFRSAAPNLATVDAETIATFCGEMATANADDTLGGYRVAVRVPQSPRGATSDGYERALELREKLGIPANAHLQGADDLETGLLSRLGVELREVTLQDRRVEAFCIAGGGYRAAMALNVMGKFSNTRWGRRMSIAHELCHILHDVDQGGRTGVVSNPWAQPLVERRANAFAVMLLAPEEALHALLAPDGKLTRAKLEQAMSTLGIGATTLLWHLKNLHMITSREREQWMSQLVLHP